MGSVLQSGMYLIESGSDFKKHYLDHMCYRSQGPKIQCVNSFTQTRHENVSQATTGAWYLGHRDLPEVSTSPVVNRDTVSSGQLAVSA